MKRLLMFAGMALALASCRNLPDFNELTYKAIVVTNHDANADFADYQTYYLPGEIRQISDNPNDTLLSNVLAAPILAAVDQNMQDRGYTKTTSILSADIGLDIVVIKVTNVTTLYPGYWWGYWGWYPYYPYSYTYTYSTGSMVMDMLDLKNIPPGGNKVNVLWTNFSSGVLGVSSTSKLAVDAVNQGFKQSEYISAN